MPKGASVALLPRKRAQTGYHPDPVMFLEVTHTCGCQKRYCFWQHTPAFEAESRTRARIMGNEPCSQHRGQD